MVIMDLINRNPLLLTFINVSGVCHADELQYLFPVGDALFPDKMPDEFDKRIADILTTLWVNFAKVK